MVYHALAKTRLTTQAPPCTGRPAATLDAMRASSTTEAPRSSTVPFTGFAALDAPAAKRHWRDVIKVGPLEQDKAVIRATYISLFRRPHLGQMK
jgi:hypothetical protein